MYWVKLSKGHLQDDLPIGYEPDEGLAEFLDAKAELSHKKKEFKLGGKELSEDDKREENRLKQTKRKILSEIIFPSFANLTYFFERVNSDPHLQDSFVEDIKDLLDVGAGIEVKQSSILKFQFTAFERLIAAILIQDTVGDKDFRLKLAHSMQKIILLKVMLTLYKDDPKSPVLDSAAEDLGKAVGWTYFVSKNLKIEDRIQRKRVKLSSKSTLDIKSHIPNDLADLCHSVYAELAEPL